MYSVTTGIQDSRLRAEVSNGLKQVSRNIRPPSPTSPTIRRPPHARDVREWFLLNTAPDPKSHSESSTSSPTGSMASWDFNTVIPDPGSPVSASSPPGSPRSTHSDPPALPGTPSETGESFTTVTDYFDSTSVSGSEPLLTPITPIFVDMHAQPVSGILSPLNPDDLDAVLNENEAGDAPTPETSAHPLSNDTAAPAADPPLVEGADVQDALLSAHDIQTLLGLSDRDFLASILTLLRSNGRIDATTAHSDDTRQLRSVEKQAQAQMLRRLVQLASQGLDSSGNGEFGETVNRPPARRVTAVNAAESRYPSFV